MKTLLLYIACTAVTALIACTSSDPIPSTSSSSSSSGSAGNHSSSSSSSGGTTGSTASAQQTAINGTWDITSAGTNEIGNSSMTVNGGQILGTILGLPEDESSGNSDGTTTIACSATTKTTFSITVNGDVAAAAIMTTTAFSPAGCDGDDDDDTPIQSNLTATRKSGSNTSNDTFSGDWIVTKPGDNSSFALNIVSLAVKAWSDSNTNGTPLLTSTVTSTQASSQTTDEHLTFAARKQ